MNLPKLILSKKGFDSDNGRGPSPILTDGRMMPLPIPEPREGACAATYGTLMHDGGSYWDLLTRLGYRIDPNSAAHLDPDIIREARGRDASWRGMLGQVDQAESHLANEGVGPGSLFLFWGWYEHEDVPALFNRSGGFSALFGYLEVEMVVDVADDQVPPFAPYHPHFAEQYPRQRNRVYIAKDRLSWNRSKPGWGVFRFSPRLRLSVEGKRRSNWSLPGCFHPDEGCVLTFNTNRHLWGSPGIVTELQIPARGQEFVCSLSGRIAEWACGLIDEIPVWTPDSVLPSVPQSVVSEPPVVPLSQIHKAKPPMIKKAANDRTRKPIPAPLPGERVVSYGDRLLWHQLALQLNGHRELMLTEQEFVTAVREHFPNAVEQNVRQYRNYFNSRHKSMGFRDASPMPMPVEFAR